MKYTVLAVCLIPLAGCASLQDAGDAHYSVQPFTDATTGKLVCCAVDVHNGKNIGQLEAHVTKSAAGDYQVDLKESSVEASQGQAIAAGAAGSLASSAAKIGLAAVLAPLAPAALPAVGAALAGGGIPAAAVGAAGVLGAQTILAPAAPVPPVVP